MKKKTGKLIVSLIVCLTMVMMMGLAVFAAEDYEIKLTKNDSAAHTFEAYQIFKGDLYGTGSEAALINIEWGEGVNGDGLVTALKQNTELQADFPKATYTASEVAEIFAGYNDRKIKIAADVIASKLTSTISGSCTIAEGTATKTGSFTLDKAGYYLIKDKDGSVADANGAYTDFILQVVDDVEVTAKADVPTLDKKIVENSEEVSKNNASIGDKVEYKITSVVPNMDGYEKYFFVINDTLSTGLTYNNDAVVKIDGVAGNVEVEQEAYGTNGFSIAIKNFIGYAESKGKTITITYSATVNKNAAIGETPNTNTAQLIYSNNPNVTYNGDNKPASGDPVGKTPEITTKTYVTEVKILKVDGKDATKKLKGAKFQIEGEGVNVVFVNGSAFNQSATGNYYLLKDGSFTETAPTAATMEKYESDAKYEEITIVNKETNSEKINCIGVTDAAGNLSFTGLKAGEYTIKELEAPEGYNKLRKDIKIRILANYGSEDSCTWSASVIDGDASVQADGTILIQIGNNQGIHMPETGGIGTMLFYLVGAGLIVLAVTLIITKRRVRNQEF